MNKLTLIIAIVFLVCLGCHAENIFILPQEPLDIAGKVLNEDGTLFATPVTVVVETSSGGVKGDVEFGDIHENRISVTDGHFTWKGTTDTSVTLTAEKEGYYSTEVMASATSKGEANAKDILIYMIPKGNPSPLEYTEEAFIPGLDDKESKGKQCGWSFSKRWYYPVTEEDVDITLGINEKNQYYYRMKSPGGFIPFEGFKQFESNPRKIDSKIEFLMEAPESGYVQDYVFSGHNVPEIGDLCSYFKTPDGKYGKMVFHGPYIDYYIQPDGSRNLELGKKIYKNPIRPSSY